MDRECRKGIERFSRLRLSSIVAVSQLFYWWLVCRPLSQEFMRLGPRELFQGLAAILKDGKLSPAKMIGIILCNEHAGPEPPSCQRSFYGLRSPCSSGTVAETGMPTVGRVVRLSITE